MAAHHNFRTREQQRAYSAQRYAERKARHECGKCSTKMPDDWKKATCEGCLQDLRGCRQAQPAPARQNGRPLFPSVALARIDRSVARCKVCLLTLPHQCIGGSATDRRGPGRVYPEGGI